MALQHSLRLDWQLAENHKRRLASQKAALREQVSKVKARVFGNSYEKQRNADSLRVPFIMPVPHDQPVEAAHSDSEALLSSDSETDLEGGQAHDPNKYGLYVPNKGAKQKGSLLDRMLESPVYQILFGGDAQLPGPGSYYRVLKRHGIFYSLQLFKTITFLVYFWCLPPFNALSIACKTVAGLLVAFSIIPFIHSIIKLSGSDKGDAESDRIRDELPKYFGSVGKYLLPAVACAFPVFVTVYEANVDPAARIPFFFKLSGIFQNGSFTLLLIKAQMDVVEERRSKLEVMKEYKKLQKVGKQLESANKAEVGDLKAKLKDVGDLRAQLKSGEASLDEQQRRADQLQEEVWKIRKKARKFGTLLQKTKQRADEEYETKLVEQIKAASTQAAKEELEQKLLIEQKNQKRALDAQEAKHEKALAKLQEDMKLCREEKRKQEELMKVEINKIKEEEAAKKAEEEKAAEERAAAEAAEAANKKAKEEEAAAQAAKAAAEKASAEKAAAEAAATKAAAEKAAAEEKARREAEDVAGLEYIERRVKIMSPTSDIWDREGLCNIRTDFAKMWPRLEAIFRNRNMAVCFITNKGTLVEHGMFCDEKGKMNHICCGTGVHTEMAAQVVDPANPAFGYTSSRSESGDVAKSQFIKYIYEGPQNEVCDHYVTQREVPGVSVSRNMTDPTSEYYKWHTIAVLIDAGAFYCDVYSVCIHPTDLDGSSVEIRKAVANTPPWKAINQIEATKKNAPSPEWSAKYCQYIAGYTDESQLKNVRITCLRQAISEAPVLSLKDALKPTFMLVREHFKSASYQRNEEGPESSSSSSSKKRHHNVNKWSDDDFFESIDESIQNTRDKLIELDLDGKFALEKAAAIHICTKESPPWYSCMNSILNDTDQFKSGKLGPNLEKFLPFVKLFQQALMTLPEKFRFEGDVYRGEKRVYPEYHNPVEHFTKAKEIVFYSPKSASKKLGMASGLIERRGTIFHIERSCCYSISAFSDFPHKEEIIIPMLSRFRCIAAVEGEPDVIRLKAVNA